jgi:uncharacterized membrane protein (DUF2068 family)
MHFHVGLVSPRRSYKKNMLVSRHRTTRLSYYTKAANTCFENVTVKIIWNEVNESQEEKLWQSFLACSSGSFLFPFAIYERKRENIQIYIY